MLVIKLVHNNDLDLVKELQELRELLNMASELLSR